MAKPKYKVGDIIWIADFDNGEEVIPREKARILAFENGMYMAEVTPEGEDDDGLREFSEDQVEGLAEETDWTPGQS